MQQQETSQVSGGRHVAKTLCVILTLVLLGCASESDRFHRSLEADIATKRKPIYQLPIHITMPIGGAIPYSVEPDLHAIVHEAILLLVQEQPGYTFCRATREARIGIRQAQLPDCRTLREQEASGAKLVLIDRIDMVEEYDTLFFQVFPVSLQPTPKENYPYGATFRTGIAYGCVNWTFSFKPGGDGGWRSYYERILPVQDCREQVVEWVTVTHFIDAHGANDTEPESNRL